MFNTVDELLSPKESIIAKAHIHNWIFVIPSFILLIGVYFWLTAGRGSSIVDIIFSIFNKINTMLPSKYSILSLDYIPDQATTFLESIRLQPRRWLSWVLMSYGLFLVYRACVTYFTTNLLQTEQRFLVQTGLIRLRTVEIPNQQIDAFDVSQNLIGRFMNFGNIIVHGTGGMSTKIPCVYQPFEFRNSGINIYLNKQAAIIPVITNQIQPNNPIKSNNQIQSASYAQTQQALPRHMQAQAQTPNKNLN
ncbi:hypothetical protein AwWohl_00450 [Gammaproteobacteria bacterium]|nr:hypothetical protein AwWohl_00450 [Gammaproteobacteria bacterium]